MIAFGLWNLSSFLYQSSVSSNFLSKIGLSDSSGTGGKTSKFYGIKEFGGGKSNFFVVKTKLGFLIF